MWRPLSLIPVCTCVCMAPVRILHYGLCAHVHFCPQRFYNGRAHPITLMSPAPADLLSALTPAGGQALHPTTVLRELQVPPVSEQAARHASRDGKTCTAHTSVDIREDDKPSPAILCGPYSGPHGIWHHEAQGDNPQTRSEGGEGERGQTVPSLEPTPLPSLPWWH